MFRWTKAVIKLTPTLISGISKINKYVKKPEKYPFDVRYKNLSKTVYKVAKGLRVIYDITGLENLPKDSKYCMMSNHISSFDPLAMLSILENPTTFVAKKEVEDFFVIGNAVKSVDGLFMDREDLKQSLKVMLKVQSDLKEGNRNWLIYPEGTRLHDSLKLVGEFHSGTFRAPIKANVPIVPICIYGTNRVLKLKPEMKKYVISISILPPIFPDDYHGLTTEEVASICHSNIQQELTYNVRIRNHKAMSKYNKKKYKFNEII